MTVSEQNLIWIDLEMTGLDPDQDLIIEIATIVTNGDLEVLAEGPVIAVHQSDEAIAAMFERGAPEELDALGAAIREHVDEAEAELDRIAERACQEASLFAADPAPLIELTEHTRKLSTA